ncbi:hypothetical protein DEU56DRAFT_916078 [Suillus clintonianus]|uniref:uncharacterized protein n=1 Tax=Suillus clintonianus TaxID=1904413 RepID=UPI001B86B052|nr:uncharacterized protein DEU56DRAFT_916078 [Suillus clintonianus]KAG2126274.1 hypothetical protein DEU56DRAFT_916078 [Suillus clintonianus]
MSHYGRRPSSSSHLMASSSASAKFLLLYESLPPDEQYALVESSLAPLLNVVSKEKSNRTLASAARMHKKYVNMPSLNLKAKKMEVTSLLDELARDNKRSYVKEQSRKEELLAEVIESVIDWLNDIWRVVYEYGTNFSKAHACLLYASQAVEQIGNARVGCKCSFMNMYISVKIRRASGKVVKSFHFTGAHNLERVMLWIWRDLFIVILADGTKRQKATIPDMLDDIRAEYGWKALERLLYGGQKPDDDDEDDDYDYYDDVDYDEDHSEDYTDTDAKSDGTACSDSNCPCGFHASHWSNKFNDVRISLRNLIRTSLVSLFAIMPSPILFASIGDISEADGMDDDDLCEELLPTLMRVATYSSENYATALHICALHAHTDNLNSLLTSHAHLLRPRDTPAHQLAIIVLATQPSYQLNALRIVEKELLDTVHAIRAAVRSAFCHIDLEANKTELAEIVALRLEALGRRGRIERWVGAVVTPSSDTAHPMALAALMMGLPLPPGMEGAMDDSDPLGYIDMDIQDPELDDLREDFRPNLKARLDGWIEAGRTIKGGVSLLLKVYTVILEMMPFMGVPDIVDEMTRELSERPSKVFLCDALDALWDFCRQQRRKFAKPKSKLKPPCTPNTSQASGQSSDSGGVTFVTINNPQQSCPGGVMDDVD